MQTIQTNDQRNATVAAVYNRNSTDWERGEIRELMGQTAVDNILRTANHPKVESLLPDRLIWLGNKSGRYTAKEGYEMLRKQNSTLHTYDQSTKAAWQRMWSWKGVIPRIKTFLWKAIHNGLPTAATLHSRIRTIPAMCQRCDTENEFIMHLLFFCDLSRATWFCSELPLIINHLPLSFPEAMLYITDNLNEDQVIAVCNLMWCLWKARNEELFTAKKSTPQTIVTRARAMAGATQGPCTDITPEANSPVRVPTGKDLILVDGSWDVKGGGRYGYDML